MAAAESEAWTVRRVLDWASADFGKRGLESPKLDAELLLGHVLGLGRVKLILEHQRPLTPDELAAYRALIQRRRGAEPIAYILGEREFYGLTFRVDPRVLVPRPDTEMLVEEALERSRAADLQGDALDLCTGSGCVAIAFAKARPTWRVTLTDADAGAAAVARDNASRLGALNALRVLEGDLFSALPRSERFHLITANPPYIPAGDMAGLMADVRDHEPHLALAGGDDGLVVVRRIVDEAPRFLHAGASLALELQYDQAPVVRDLFARRGFETITTRRDYQGHERVVAGTWPG